MASENIQLTRRALLGGTGAFVVGLAGCASNSDSNSTSKEDNDVLVIAGGRTPTEVHFNPYNAANYAHTYGDLMRDYVARGHSDGSVTPDLLEEMTIEGKDLILRFPKGRTWWSGDDLTAEDYYINCEITRLQDPENSDFEGHELVDDYTLKRTFKTKVSPKLMRASVAGVGVSTPRWIFKKYLERYQDASTQKKRDAISEDLIGMTIPTQRVADEGLGNGLYQLTKFNSSQSTLEKFEDHPYADRTNISTVRIHPKIGEDIGTLRANDKLDMSFFGYLNDRQLNSPSFPDNLKNQYKLDWFRTQKFTFNYKNKHLSKRPVRRAIMAAVDLKSITAAATQTNITGKPTQIQTGLRSSIHDEFLGEGFADKLIKYPVGKDQKAAETYMEQAGYKNSGGTWSKNGNEFSLNVITDDYESHIQATKVFTDQLNEFGIQTDVNTIGTDYYTKLQEYEYDIAWIWHVARAIWHPVSYFSNDFYGVLAGDPSSGNETGPTGIPFELTIPKKVGAKEVSGDGRTINPAKLMVDMTTASSAAKVKEMTRTLVQWFNYDLPSIVWIQENSGFWGDEDNFTFPDPEKKTLNIDRPGQYAWKMGWINKK